MENNFNIEVDKSSKKTIIIFIVFFGCLLLFTIFYLIINSSSERKQKLLSIDRQTRVIEIYANRNQHNLGYVRFSNGVNEFLEYPYKVGDSISKKKGDSIEYIFRKDSIIKNNYFEEARKNGLLK
ncbi:hypothetical protein IW15_15920 [Chryseobacterium soli]|uniref:Uncharacterized protein n=1 Tax=Chryseobacterium soli TaxID=445961 RepID=A0A086A4S8_9FLAO|nr:hypothetical protein [Chryseobacterium soli]KFF11692.1 hypothetical protein IW15_15920 [Chryseobacterium soli]